MTVYKAKEAAGRIGLYALVPIAVLPILSPLYFVFISSLKNMPQVYTMPPQLFDFTPIWNHYKYIFETQHYDAYMVNSAIATLASTVAFLIFEVPASYPTARLRMRRTSAPTFMARLLPNISSLLPYYFLFPKLKMIDTYSVLILSHIVLSLPLTVWITSSFIADIPEELDETVIVDGCIRQRCFWNVTLPVSLPGLVTYVTLSFLGSWNNFQFALVLSGGKTRTLSVSLQYFVSGVDIRWGRMLAMTIVVIVLATILTMALQKYIIKGITAGTAKG